MAGRLAGKTAFITAAGQGMGRAAALAFAREGAKVWASDMNAKTVAELDGKDGIRTRPLDVTNENEIKEISAEVGDIDVLFNCAGIVHHGSILDASVKDWDQAFAVNVKLWPAPTVQSIWPMPEKASLILLVGMMPSVVGMP